MEPLLASLTKVLSYIAGPLIGLFAWLGKRMHKRIDSVEERQRNKEIRLAVLESQQKDLKEDILELKVTARETNNKLDKIIDKLSKK